MGRERESTQETSPDSCSGAWGCVRAGEDDLCPFGDEPILLGLGENGLPKLRWHPASRRIGDLPLSHLVLVSETLDAHL
jgi:hypothetical protein